MPVRIRASIKLGTQYIHCLSYETTTKGGVGVVIKFGTSVIWAMVCTTCSNSTAACGQTHSPLFYAPHPLHTPPGSPVKASASPACTSTP